MDKLNNTLQNEEWVKTKIKKEMKNFLELCENEYTTVLNLWCTGSGSKWQVTLILESHRAREIIPKRSKWQEIKVNLRVKSIKYNPPQENPPINQ